MKLTRIDQFIMAFGGLRGGIAFCLALSLEEELIPEKKLFVTATIIIVFFTVFVQVSFLLYIGHKLCKLVCSKWGLTSLADTGFKLGLDTSSFRKIREK